MIENDHRSLLDAFDPPPDLVGQTAIFVTMTADTDVLDAMLTRFTGLTARERGRTGRCIAYLLRDAGRWSGRTSVLAPGDVPGLHELRPRLADGRRPRLLHAKLALLTFGPRGADKPSHARLVVTTGNFTRSSLQRQLELVHVTEAELRHGDDADLADVQAAATFVRDLARIHFEARPELLVSPTSPLRAFGDVIKRLIGRRTNGTPPRFLHSLERPMLGQLSERAKLEVPGRRNLLVCGSAFFESEVDRNEGPSVLRALADAFPLTQGGQRILLVEPATSGQLRAWATNDQRRDWSPPVRASDPVNARRALHAKFLLVGRLQEDGRTKSVARGSHLYLGSANLTRQGMAGADRQQGGNIECGVFFEVTARLDEQALANQLFWKPDAEPISADQWGRSEDTDDRPSHEVIDTSPVLHAEWFPDQQVLHLVWASDASEEIRIALTDGTELVVPPNTQSVPLPAGRCPATLELRTSDGRARWCVPVIDPLGRYAWQPESLASFADLLGAVARTPHAPGVEDEESEEEEEEEGGSSGQGPKPGSLGPERIVERRYPLLDMATMLEAVAHGADTLQRDDVDQWLDHLERLRDRPISDRLRLELKATPVRFLSHLKAPALAPAGMKPSQRDRYERLIDDLEQRWASP